jgi:NADPH2:quinone reductase
MQAIEITQPGGPQVLQCRVRPDPVPGSGEMLVAGAGQRRRTVRTCCSAWACTPCPRAVSDLPGLEIAGTVAGGDPAELAAAGWKLGDAVCALVAGGGYAQRCVAPIGQCLPVPARPHGRAGRLRCRRPSSRSGRTSSRSRGCSPARRCSSQGGSSGIGVTAVMLAKANWAAASS